MRRRIAQVGAGAAIVGGLAWVAKGGWILLTLDQPPVLYELGPPLFLVATWGLWHLLPATAPKGPAGIALAVAAVLFLVAAVLAVRRHLAGAPWETASSLASALAMLAFLVALAWIGRLMRRAKTLRPVHALPFVMALAFLPLLVALGVLGIALGGTLEERLIEVPIVLWGVGWLTLGMCMLRPPGQSSSS